jgi:pimeloyl-ACP methyl ester carboxylesterase
MLRLVDDVLALVKTLDHGHVHALIGHDFGSPVAAWCALTRPDIFRSVVLMSAPFAGPPDAATAAQTHTLLTQEVAALEQLAEPRQHYQRYYSNREANADMWHAPQGLHPFMRAYYHVKSADWEPNQPHRLKAWQASELAKLPHYYVMPGGKNMAQAVAEFMPDGSQTPTWMSTARSTPGAVTKAACSGTGARRTVMNSLRCQSSADKAFKCLLHSWLAQATGGFTNFRGRLKKCKHRHAATCGFAS